jgi:anaerobic selenocysteine-containing dehydrogenase
MAMTTDTAATGAGAGKREVYSACPHDCPDTCAMVTTVEDGRAVAVRGRRDHPFTRGTLCVKVKNFEERVYSPQRLLHPMRRVGAKGEGRFERTTWDSALAEIHERFTAIIDAHGAEAIVPCSYIGQQGLVHGLNSGDAFFNRLGATVAEKTMCASAANSASVMTTGYSAGVDPLSFVHARTIVIWGCNTLSTHMHQWPMIAEAQAKGATVVVVDPIRSRTAARADWHVKLRPGTDAALALGLIHVIVAEGLVDEDYVTRHTVGFDALRARADSFPPDRVAGITGVAADEIRRLARAYATGQPSVLRVGVAIERHRSGGQTVRALAALPALVGAWRHVGGGILQSAARALPTRGDVISRPDFIRPGTRVLNTIELGRALTGRLGSGAPVKALFVYNCNPAVTLPEAGLIRDGLARDDLFTVVSEQFQTDTADYADLLLPATTQLEQFELGYSWGQFFLALNQPAIAPLGEAVPNAEMFRRLAAAFGFNEPYFRRSDEEIARDAVDWSHPALAGVDLERLKRDGYARLSVGDPDTRRPHAEGNFPTPSGKCELVASRAVDGDLVLPRLRQGHAGDQPAGPVDPVPDFVAPPPGDPRYPLTLLSPASHAFLNSSYGNLPVQRRAAGEPFAAVHPEDAAARGIAEGDRVRVFNDLGAIEVDARLTDDTQPGVIVVPVGYWKRIHGREVGVNVLNPAAYTDIGRGPALSDTRVEVAPVAG